jgi:hypothetical protein
MQRTIKKHDTATARAIAAYRGKITTCKPGAARAPSTLRDTRDTAANNRALHNTMRRVGLPGLRRDY